MSTLFISEGSIFLNNLDFYENKKKDFFVNVLKADSCLHMTFHAWFSQEVRNIF